MLRSLPSGLLGFSDEPWAKLLVEPGSPKDLYSQNELTFYGVSTMAQTKLPRLLSRVDFDPRGPRASKSPSCMPQNLNHTGILSMVFGICLNEGTFGSLRDHLGSCWSVAWAGYSSEMPLREAAPKPSGGRVRRAWWRTKKLISEQDVPAPSSFSTEPRKGAFTGCCCRSCIPSRGDQIPYEGHAHLLWMLGLDSLIMK